MMRIAGPKTLIPDVVMIKSTGEEIEVKDRPVMTALVAAIGEDFMEPTRGGVTDVVSAAANARITLEVLEHAGLMAVEQDATFSGVLAERDHLRSEVTVMRDGLEQERIAHDHTRTLLDYARRALAEEDR